MSISCTTRPKRKGEIHKKDYLFLSDRQFSDLIKKNKFLEYAEVFGFKYGTLKKTILNFFNKKKDVLFDIVEESLRLTMDELTKKGFLK